MDVYLVRHAIGETRDSTQWPDDSERPLTPEGEARFRKAARGLGRVAPHVDVVLASPFVRAWQTAEILELEAGWPVPERAPELEATRTPADGLDLLRRHASGSVALVGHEPFLSGLASLLLAGDENAVAIELKKGAVVLLTLSPDIRPASAFLRWTATPKILRALA
ncbi:MAG TPA: histidine phosphatase family protein [Gaiellaceae bacterium]